MSAKMTGQAATSSLRKMRECTAMPPENAKCHGRDQRDAPVAHDETDEGGENQHAPGCDQPGEKAPGTNGAGHGGIERGDIGCRRYGRQRPGVEQACACSSRNQSSPRQWSDMRCDRRKTALAVVEGKRVVDHMKSMSALR